MILTVTPSPALDLTWQVDKLLPGETLRTLPGDHRAGGKGVNVARVAASMGHATEVVAPIGGETGDRFRRELDASGLASFLLPVQSETRQTATIVDRALGQATVISEEAPALTTEEWADLIALVESRLGGATVLVVSGRISQSAPDDLLTRLVDAARASGVPTVVDTSGPPMLDAARAGATLLKPNRDELVAATGQSSVAAGIDALLQLGAGMVCVSLGEDGLAAATRGDGAVLHRAALRRPVHGNATGAGDAAVAALAVGLAESQSLDRMLRTAAIWAGSAVSMPLAGEVDAARLRALELDLVPANELVSE